MNHKALTLAGAFMLFYSSCGMIALIRKVAARCDFVINNDGKTPLKPQIEKLLETVREKS